MMLSRFTKPNKPKWQHRDPDMRKIAVEDLEDNATLSEIAQHDESAPVRRAAVRKIDDLAILHSVAQQDEDSSVRELAIQRFKQLLCGQKDKCPDLEERSAWLEKITDTELLEYVGIQARETQLRLTALTKIQREGLLGDIAINDAESEVRRAAAEKLTQKSTLERVSKAVRNRDKQVNRIVREKLDKITEQLERPARIRAECEAICKQIEALARDAKTPSPITRLAEKWELINTELKRSQARWDKVAIEAEETFKERFTRVQQQLIETYGNYQHEQEALQQREQALIPLRTAKRTLCEEIEAIGTELQALEQLPSAKEEEFGYRLSVLQSEWRDIQPLESIEEREWCTRFEKAYQIAEMRYQLLRETYQTATALEAICVQMETQHHREERIKPRYLKEYQEQWTAISRTTKAFPLLTELNNRFHQALQALQTQLQQQTARQEQDFETLKSLIKEIEVKLESGEFHAALPLEQEARELQQKLSDLSPSRFKSLESHLQKLSFKINELRGWARWGDDRERENLCVQMEALLERVDDNPEETARLIQEAQQAWKKLGTTKQAQKLWERFNRACNEAYRPCKVYFEEKAQEREDNFLEKQKLCEELEALAQGTDWADPNCNWKGIYHAIHDIEKAWHKIGTTNRKARKQVTRRFDKTMQALETHLAEERQRNRRYREQLIEQVKTVQTIENLQEAIRQAKALQDQWQITIPSSRREEHQLWKAFRSACDVVFERRKEQRNETKKEQQAHLNQKVAICEQVEALAKSKDEALKSASAQIKKWQTEWRGIRNIPKRSTEAIEKRFTTACKQVMTQYQTLLLAEKRQQMDLLQQKAQICTELEQVTGDNLDTLVETKREQWATLPTLADIKTEEVINQRFEQACQIALGEPLQRIEETIKARELLCTRLEIATGIESPPEAVEARLAYQVSRLSEAMSGGDVGSTDKLTEIQEIERAWYLTGAIPREKAETLQKRFDRAYQVSSQLQPETD